MTYVTDQMRAALAEHRLRQVCNSNGVRVFRMSHPAGILLVDIVALAEYLLVSAGDRRTMRSQFGCSLAWLAEPMADRHLCTRFLSVEWPPHDTDDAGWLCAIQQRFAELYREREARIEAIVAGWEWQSDTAPGAVLRVHGIAVAFARPTGHWSAFAPDGCALLDSGNAESFEAAKEAARAAVLRQAKEHPEMWWCGEVDE